MLVAMANRYGGIVPKEVVEKEGDLTKVAVGTGPFMLEEWKDRVHLKLKRNPDYWDKGKPYLDGLTIQVIPDEASVIAGLRTGTVHHTLLEDAKNYDLVKDNKALTVMRGQAARWDLLDLNASRPPLNNLKVRQAISLAIDRKEVLEGTVFGLGTLTGPIPPVVKDYALPVEKLPFYQYDPDKAKQLIQESGVPAPLKFKLRVIPTFPTMVQAATIIVDQLKKVGMQIEIESVEYGTWIKDYFDGNYDATMNLGSGAVDADSIMYRKFHPQQRDFSKLKDEELGKLLDEQRQALDKAKRKEIVDQLQIKIAEKAGTIYLFSGDLLDVMQTSVKGYRQHPTGWAYSHRETWLDK